MSGNLWGEEDMFDAALMNILHRCGKMQPFFECIFSFLSRRTDFYIIMENEKAKMGFPQGVSLNMVIQAFKKYEILTRKREAELMREAATRRIDLMTDDMTQVPELDIPATTEEHLTQLANVSTTEKFPSEEEKPLLESEEPAPKESDTAEQKQPPTISPPAPKIPKLSEAAKATVSRTSDKEQIDPTEKDKPVVAAQASKKAVKTDRTEETAKARERKLLPKAKEPTKDKVQEAAKKETEEPTGNRPQATTKKEESEQKKEQPVTKKEELVTKKEDPPTKKEDAPTKKEDAPTKKEDAPPTKKENAPPTKKEDAPPTKKEDAPAKKLEPLPEVYNGAKTDKYSWSQTMTDLDVAVIVPENVTAKDLKVDIRSDHLKITVTKPEEKVLIDGQLLHRIKVEESMWSMDKKAHLTHLALEKSKELMWKSLFEGEEGIDLTKVDTTRDISEFDEEAQAAIQRVTYDHHMKMLGKPTSSQQKAHDILKKAWDAPGSPFKGTPFDPTRVNIAGVW